MRNLYAGMLVLLLCGATLLSLGGCQENLALLGDDVGDNDGALTMEGDGKMSLWSSEEKTLVAADDGVKPGDAEDISAMSVPEDSRTATQDAADSVGEITPLTAEPMAEETANTNSVDVANDLPEMQDLLEKTPVLTEAAMLLEVPEITAEPLNPAADSAEITLPDAPAATMSVISETAAAENIAITDTLPQTVAAETLAAAAADSDMALPEIDETLDAAMDAPQGTDWREALFSEEPEVPGIAADNAIENTDVAVENADTAATIAAGGNDGEEAKNTVAETPAETTSSAETSPITELVDKEKIKRQAIDVEANHHYKKGVDFFNAGRYSDALTALDKALTINPALTEAAEYRTRARQLVGRPTGDQDAALLDEIVRSNDARLKERELRLNSGLEKASEYYLKTVAPDEVRKVMGRSEQIQMNLIDLEAAEQSLNAVQSLLQGSGLPQAMEKTLEMRSRALAAQINQEREKLVNERASLDRALAENETRQTQKNAAAEKESEINSIIAAAEYHFTRAEYEDALTLVEQVIHMDKTNTKAMELRRKIRDAGKLKQEVENRQNLIDAEDHWALDVQEAYIMPRRVVVYPLDWEKVRQRAKKANSATVIDLEERKIMNALNDIVGDFEYVEQSLAMVMNDFAQRAKICITMANGVNGEDTVKTARLTGVTMKAALDQIMEDMKMTYKYEDEALVIYPRSTGLTGTPVMQIYTIADIVKRPQTFRVKKRMSNNIIMSGENAADAGAWGDDDDDDDDDDDEEWEGEQFNLVDEIKKRIGTEGTWEHPYGVSRWEDNLVVFNVPEIHSQISKYLEEWRASSRQQVLVEGRFMDIDDNFSEEFGIDWSGSKQELGRTHEYQTGLSYAGGSTNNSWGATYADPEGNELTRAGGWLTNAAFTSSTNAFNYALNTLRLNLTVRASQQMEKGSILHNPKVLVSNGQTAFCQIIVNRPYVGNYTISNNNVLPVIQETYQGVTWETRPVISFDKKYVTVRVRPEIVQDVSEVEVNAKLATPGSFRPRVSVDVTLNGGEGEAAGNSIWHVEIERPVSRVTDFWTNATVPDGGTLLIGGQLRDKSIDNVSGIPLFSSLPYVGRLMRTNNKGKTASNRVIMLSAKIVELED